MNLSNCVTRKVSSWVISAALVLLITVPAIGQDSRVSGVTEKFAANLKVPLGYDALRVLEVLNSQTFEQNIETSNKWIRAQLAAYHYGDPNYQRQLSEMITGSYIEGGLGMANWLTDPSNAGVWDKKVRSAVGNAGYARVVALNEAFPPGSMDFCHIYGGERRHNSRTNKLILNVSGRSTVPMKSRLANPRKFDELLKFGDEVRVEMFNFYEAFKDGKVSQRQVKKFNATYTLVGGCAVAATDVANVLLNRYAAGLNLFAKELGELGFPVKKMTFK